MTDQQVELTDVSVREFNRLMTDLLQGRLQRNGFRRWEIAVLLDLETCKLRRSTRRETLRRYQQVMSRRLEAGEPLLLVSKYLEVRRRRRRAAEPVPDQRNVLMRPPVAAVEFAPAALQ